LLSRPGLLSSTGRNLLSRRPDPDRLTHPFPRYGSQEAAAHPRCGLLRTAHAHGDAHLLGCHASRTSKPYGTKKLGLTRPSSRTPWSACCTVTPPPSSICSSGCHASLWSLLAKQDSASLLIACQRRYRLASTICLLQDSLCALLSLPFVVTAHNTDERIRPLLPSLQGFVVGLLPSIVKIGPPKFWGFLAEIAPHPNIRRLREIVRILYDTNKSIYQRRVHAVAQAEDNGAFEGSGRDILGALSEWGSSLDHDL
jgi:hypothetical protein